MLRLILTVVFGPTVLAPSALSAACAAKAQLAGLNCLRDQLTGDELLVWTIETFNMFYKKVYISSSGKMVILKLFSDLVREKDSANVLHTASHLLLLLVHLRQLLRHSVIVQLLQGSL